MAETSTDSKLIKAYESLRQREQMLISKMLEILPRIDGLAEDPISHVRDALFHANHPYLMVFVGPFSSGKSSIINVILGERDLLQTGPTPTTDRITVVRWGDESGRMESGGDVDTVFYPSPLLKQVSFVDTPGLESTITSHEDTTQAYLHHADVVILVMLATQAMTARTADYLRQFKQYGKKVIIAVNQTDLISLEEIQTVRAYVREQAQKVLGTQPEVWMISTRDGWQVRDAGEVGLTSWKNTGLHHFEEYIEKQLSDAERLRQKLLTPLQIVQKAHTSGLAAVKSSQATFDQYRGISDNIQQQLEAQKRDQLRAVRDTLAETEALFGETISRAELAIRDTFRFSRAPGSFIRGLGELVGIARLFRRADSPSYVQSAFERSKVFEPIGELSTAFSKLGPRLEGQDMQNLDELVQYGNREIGSLPPTLRGKVIGSVQAPVKYDRSALEDVRSQLDDIEDRTRRLETAYIEGLRRNALIYLAVWELIVGVLLVAVLMTWSATSADQSALPIILTAVLLAVALLGFVAVPLRGRAVQTQYANRILKQQAAYQNAISLAADKQIEYAMRLRRDTIAPLTRLVESQGAIHDEQMAALQRASSEMSQIEADLNALGKRKILGVSL